MADEATNSNHRIIKKEGNNKNFQNELDDQKEEDNDLIGEKDMSHSLPPRDRIAWIEHQIENNGDPRRILQELIPDITVPDHIDDITLWRIAIEILSEPPVRQPLKHINSLEHVKKLISECKNIVVLTGAGVSVSCGIPDFRSRDGIYARLSQDYPDLPNPQSMFDIHYFRTNQWPFFKFAKEIYPGQFTPSLSHRFISYLDKTGRLLRNYSQNIDTLEQVAGIKNVIQCHGSFATATCMNCKIEVKAEDIKEDIFQQRIPYCTKCKIDDENEEAMNILKPDIVFFGESLPQAFHKQIEEDKDKADLLIVIGSSLKVRPVSLIPNLIKPDVPQILINREPLNHMSFDVELYGNCDDIIAEICTQLGSDWTSVIDNFVTKPLDRSTLPFLFKRERDSEEEKQATEIKENIENCDVYNKEINVDVDEEIELEATRKNSTCNRPEIHKHNDFSDSCDKDKTVAENNFEAENSNCESNTGEKGLKRERSTDEDEEKSSAKRKKIDSSSEDIFYLHLPPNKYMFYGAELGMEDEYDCSDLDGEETDTEATTEDESDDDQNTDDNPHSNIEGNTSIIHDENAVNLQTENEAVPIPKNLDGAATESKQNLESSKTMHPAILPNTCVGVKMTEIENVNKTLHTITPRIAMTKLEEAKNNSSEKISLPESSN